MVHLFRGLQMKMQEGYYSFLFLMKILKLPNMITRINYNLVTLSSMRFNIYFGIALILILCIPSLESQAQASKSFANEVTFTSPDDKMTSLVGCGGLGLSPCYAPTVQNPGNSLTDNDQFARVLASP